MVIKNNTIKRNVLLFMCLFFSTIKHWILNKKITKNLGAQGSKSWGQDMWKIIQMLLVFINFMKSKENWKYI